MVKDHAFLFAWCDFPSETTITRASQDPGKSLRLIFTNISEREIWILRANKGHNCHKKPTETRNQINTNKMYLPLCASLELARDSPQGLGLSFVWCHSYWYSFSAQSLYPSKRCLSSRDRRRGGRWGHVGGPCSVKRVCDSGYGWVSISHHLCPLANIKTH